MSSIVTQLQRALVTSSTATSYASKVPTKTEPTGDGIFTFGSKVPIGLHVSFFGAGSDNDTFDARILGWDRIGTDPFATLWIPRILASFSCILSAQVGVAGCPLINTDRFADSIVVHASIAPQANFTDLVSAAAATRGTIKTFSPANDLIAWAEVPIPGCEKIEWQWDMTGATNGNAVFRYLWDV